MNKKIKKHLISAAVTFGSAFIITIAPLAEDILSGRTEFGSGVLVAAVVGATMAGGRAVLKLLVELSTPKEK
ncbi:MAG TPA: hypothetical protein PLQ36_02825 [Candidatus Gracilibacteria bacterium]|nr:hypothetical protein [Candidatus Gracilibacteria bacterium]